MPVDPPPPYSTRSQIRTISISHTIEALIYARGKPHITNIYRTTHPPFFPKTIKAVPSPEFKPRKPQYT